MAIDKKAVSAAVAAALGGLLITRRRGRGAPDPAHAPGHQHLGPPPEADVPPASGTHAPHDQPYIRTTHLDSQKRRFRR